MKIAVATDDTINIRKGFFGRSAYFRVIEFLNGSITGSENRLNPYAADVPGRPGSQTHKIVELLDDCELFMGSSMAKEALPILKAHKIDCIITDQEVVDLAVQLYLDGDEDSFKYYDPEKDDFRPCAERVLKIAADR